MIWVEMLSVRINVFTIPAFIGYPCNDSGFDCRTKNCHERCSWHLLFNLLTVCNFVPVGYNIRTPWGSIGGVPCRIEMN
jgi:hypothetical protein